MRLRLSNVIRLNALLLCGFSVLQGQTVKLAEGPGKDATVKVCGNCHGVEVAVSRRESKDGWSGVVDDMVQRGAVGTDEEFGQIVDYLSANYSKTTPSTKVNINTASAKILATALGVSDQQAAAIVSFRDENGKFKAVADLTHVPGIDEKVVLAKKSNLTI